MSNASRIECCFRFVTVIAIVLSHTALSAADDKNADRIKAYAENPRYWQYKGEPVLVLGGSDDDNLFQWTGSRLTEHLDLLKSVGGNYVRCTMSSRDEGNVWPFKQVNGKYNLDQWNEEYWWRFEEFLKAASARDIIVQIEIWATYDFKPDNRWQQNPFHPKNNINYTVEETGLPKQVNSRPGYCENSFFWSVPAERNQRTVRKYQRRFVDKVLSCSLKFGNVLYCMDNETSATPQWGKYWSEYVKTKAKEAGVDVQATEMWYDHLGKDPPIPHATFDHPETYSFVDVSQNSHKRGQRHWDSLRLQLSRVDDRVRPLTNVKIYGADTGPERWFRADVDGVERFWRNILGGMASARFHRPPAGLGLGKKAQANIHSLRMLTDNMDIFTCTAHNELLSDRKSNEAYCLANPGKEYAVYFPNGGEVVLDIGSLKGPGTIRWLRISTAKWGKQQELKPAQSVTLRPPGSGSWAVLLTRKTTLPYGNRRGDVRVVYDNDQTLDVYTDEVLMAMAGAGRIQLVGMITTRTVNGIGYDKYDELVVQRKQLVNLARQSGMRHLPDPVKGPRVSLQPPASGKIEDTETIGSDGSRLIVRQARKASPSNPLVVICGGQLTAVADAYLLDPSINDKMVVAALLGSDKDMGGFNGLQDPWADYIVLQRLRYVQFPQSQAIPKVPKDWLQKKLPDTPLRRWMLAKIHPLFPDKLPGDEDNDGQPVLPLLSDEHVIEVKRVAFGGWKSKRFGKGSVHIPTFVSAERNGNSRALVVVKANGKVGTQAWQAAMADPAAWHPTNSNSTRSSDKAANKSDVVLPYNNTNPVIYDNDWTNDYVDWYLMALASAGDIKYRGISTSSSVAPYNRHMTAKNLAAQVAKRQEIVRRGRDSGFHHVPEPIPGTKGNLIKPPSGRIEDTKPLDSPGSRRIIEEAGRATPTKPLVVCVGGPLTVVADAYLLDNSIAEKVVVAWLDNHNKGMTGFNGWSDGWAAYIVLKKLRLVQFTVQSKPFPHVPKSRLHTLPDTEARDYMLALQTDVVAPEGDADGPPAISLMRPDYVRSAKRVSFGGWTRRDGHDMPVFKDDPNGRAIVVTSVDREAATEEWWRAMRNPAAWRPTNGNGMRSSGNGNATSAQTIQAPYPSSPVVKAMRLDWSTHKRFAQGSDNFQLAWADDNHLYGAWGDGGGFGGTNEDGRVSLGVARVEGPWNNYKGYNIWGGKQAETPAQFKGKSWGMICIKGVLYMWVVPDYSGDGPKKIWHYSEARLAKSTDHGAHWTRANWAFFESEKLIIPTICNFGKNYAGARDNYVYHYFICPQDNLPPHDVKRQQRSLIVHKPGRIYLARVYKDKIFDSRDHYQFFTGLNKNGSPKWGGVSAKQPVFEDRNGCGCQAYMGPS